MTAVALGAALINGEAAAANEQPLLPQLPVARLPGLADLPVPQLLTLLPPLQFGEQLRQSMDVVAPDAAAMPTLPVVVPMQGQRTLEAQQTEPPTEQPETLTDEPADEATLGFSSFVPLSQPIVIPLEYVQRSIHVSQPQPQPQSQLQPQLQLESPPPASPSAVTVTQWTTPDATARDNALLSALQATNPATMLPVTKGTPAATARDNPANAAMTQLASLTNGSLVQALVDGVTQQPGVLAPVAKPPAQSVNVQRSPLEVALGERLQLQITQRSQHAVIRLDPPSMGTIEIVVQREAGSIQVHLRASNAEVARQLHGIGDSLRQDLVHRQHGDVSVHVSDGSREQSASQQGQRQSHAQRDTPGRALSESNEDSSKSFTLAVDEERAA